MEVNNLPNKEFKVMAIKRLTKLRREWRNTMRTSAKS